MSYSFEQEVEYINQDILNLKKRRNTLIRESLKSVFEVRCTHETDDPQYQSLLCWIHTPSINSISHGLIGPYVHYQNGSIVYLWDDINILEVGPSSISKEDLWRCAERLTLNIFEDNKRLNHYLGWNLSL